MALPRLTVDQAADCLAAGGVVILPTESGYVIACRAFDQCAVARVVAVKKRPGGKPLPVLLPSPAALSRYIDSPLAVLADTFWPGPLTLVVPAFPGLPAEVTAGTNMVGVRVCDHPIARGLVERLGPLVATSANQTGQPAAHDPNTCDLAGLDDIDGLVDGGVLPPGANTVVGFVAGDLTFFAQGELEEDHIRAIWNDARSHE